MILSRFVDRDMFMPFRGGGIGHLSTGDATKSLLLDRPYDEFQNINNLEDIVEDDLLEDVADEKLLEDMAEDELLQEIAEGELPEDILGGEPEDIAEGELVEDGTAGVHERDNESQNESECLEEGSDYDI
jgi:hypothetical protein